MRYPLNKIFPDDIACNIEQFNPIWQRRNELNSGAWLSIHRELIRTWYFNLRHHQEEEPAYSESCYDPAYIIA